MALTTHGAQHNLGAGRRACPAATQPPSARTHRRPIVSAPAFFGPSALGGGLCCPSQPSQLPEKLLGGSASGSSGSRRGVACMAHPRRVAKVTSQVQREIADMFINDAVVSGAICPERKSGDTALSAVASITQTYVSNDLQVVKVYVSVYSDDRGKKIAMANLQQIAPYVRKQIGQRMRLRRTPEIRFEYDDTIEEADLVARVIGGEEVARIEAELEAEARAARGGGAGARRVDAAAGKGEDDDDDEGFFDSSSSSSTGREGASAARRGAVAAAGQDDDDEGLWDDLLDDDDEEEDEDEDEDGGEAEAQYFPDPFADMFQGSDDDGLVKLAGGKGPGAEAGGAYITRGRGGSGARGGRGGRGGGGARGARGGGRGSGRGRGQAQAQTQAQGRR